MKMCMHYEKFPWGILWGIPKGISWEILRRILGEIPGEISGVTFVSIPKKIF